MIIEVRVRMVGDTVTRHLVVEGMERALCGRLTLRPPTLMERWAARCGQCEGTLEKLKKA